MENFAIGERAAIYQNDYASGRFTLAIVERDTKLYWIANGRKFRKRDGVEPGDNSGWNRTTYLLPITDKRVVESGIAARKSAAYGQVLRAQEALSKDRESLEAIAAVKAALDTYAEALA